MGAALAAAAAALQGWSIVYLGADVPHVDIESAATATTARAVVLSITYVEDRARAVAEVRALREKMKDALPLLVGGAGAASLAAAIGGNQITLCETLGQLRRELARIESARSSWEA